MNFRCCVGLAFYRDGAPIFSDSDGRRIRRFIVRIGIRVGIRICVRVIIIITARRCSDRGTYGAQTSKAQQNRAQTTTAATGKLINGLYLGEIEIG